ncbi:uncharacterized protein LOC126265549 [Aethina tumida]|uniref:uncharacterized protein LOC126265549 n=1 Tax=Aethina tumida TaxID=116153 RepID=UPI0021486C95|nr:uncharacterized protein LOC126265549 [Aethina tumida]
MNGLLLLLLVVCVVVLGTSATDAEGRDAKCCEATRGLTTWQGSWEIFPTAGTWSFQTKLPETMDDETSRQERGKYKVKKKFKKFLLPLLLAYKLKFFTLIPVLIGGLVLLTGATGLAGFFFALFAATMGLKSGH